MAVQPVTRYMILCEDWEATASEPRRISVYGLLSNLHSLDTPPYPLLIRELCVMLILTEGRATGTAQIVCVFEETGQRIFATPKRRVEFGPDPLEVTALPFRIRDCPFPYSGVYSIQFWYNGVVVEECPLRLR